MRGAPTPTPSRNELRASDQRFRAARLLGCLAPAHIKAPGLITCAEAWLRTAGNIDLTNDLTNIIQFTAKLVPTS